MMAQERGFAFFDPHGDAAQRVRAAVVAGGRELTYIDISSGEGPGYNPLTRVSFARRPLVCSGMLSAMKKAWPEAWGMRMEHILRNVLLALLDQPAAQLPDVLRLLDDKQYRREVVRRIENDQVRSFWTTEFKSYSPRYWAEMTASIRNKIGAFLSDPRLRQFVCPTDEGLRLRAIMDRGQPLIVNLPKGTLGEDSASILGALLVNSMAMAALSRADVPANERRPFFLYLDEFQNFTTLALVEMFSELRKFGLGIVASHQFLDQIDVRLRHAVLGNAGTIICFRTGPDDARTLAKHFEPAFGADDLANLPNHHMYLRLMIDGTPSQPFSAKTLCPEGATYDFAQGCSRADDYRMQQRT